uniref:Ig-like domain-containing protein n=1 Tax=Pelusios castaneus TaxID=367368 RepID=A0A8C8VJY0_9SAUR
MLLTLLTLPHCKGRAERPVLMAIFLPSFFLTPTLHQTPRFISVSPGALVQLHCYLHGYSSTSYLYWYRQPPQGGALHLLFLSVTPKDVSNGFTASRPDTEVFYLNTTSVKMDHSGLYFCASSLDTALQSHLRPLQKPPSSSPSLSGRSSSLQATIMQTETVHCT